MAVAILLAAMLKPVANRLHALGPAAGRGRGHHPARRHRPDRRRADPDHQLDRRQAAELSDQVVTGFTQLWQWLRNGPLPIDQSWSSWTSGAPASRQFLADSQSTIAAYAGDIGTRVGHFLAGVAICLFALFYFLYDGRGIFSFLLNLMPRARPGPGRRGGARAAGSRCRRTSGRRCWWPWSTPSAC